MKKLYMGIIAIVGLFLLFGCLGSGGSSSHDYKTGDSAQVNKEDKVPALEILDSHMEKDEYLGYSVIGTAKAHKDFSYAEISVKCYDTNDAVIGSYLTNMNNLKNGETWNFKVIVPTDQKVATYSIANGNSW